MKYDKFIHIIQLALTSYHCEDSKLPPVTMEEFELYNNVCKLLEDVEQRQKLGFGLWVKEMESTNESF